MSQRNHHPKGDSPQPFRSARLVVEDAWIDYNGHLNMAYYNVLFDRAVDQFLEALGIGPSYVKARNASMFALEAHLCYVRELTAGDPVVVDVQILGHDAKRAHLFLTLRHADAGFLSATSEQVTMHVDLATRRSAPFPDDRLAALAALAARHANLPRPENAGRSVGLKRNR